MNTLIEQLKLVYTNWGEASLAQLPNIYAQNVVFEDAIHKVEGLDGLLSYFTHTMAGLTSCRFEFHDQVELDGKIVLTWTMHYAHPRLKKGEDLTLEGITWLTLDDQEGKVVYHRDYYDLTEMVLDHVPVLGWACQQVKQRLKGAAA